MFGDIQELLVIFIIALLVVGPKKLPEVAKAAGKFVGELKRALTEVRFELDQEINAKSRMEQSREEASEAGREMETKEKAQAVPEYESARDSNETGGHEMDLPETNMPGTGGHETDGSGKKAEDAGHAAGSPEQKA
ncbi:MAG: Sec-independent protein translocase protein TatB [Nitrospiraceae bacterium]|nr:Sec-independent protein translocase protein TatB [Nitrospiraceae bacterium]